jgi:uracil-DNA glycosylase
MKRKRVIDDEEDIKIQVNESSYLIDNDIDDSILNSIMDKHITAFETKKKEELNEYDNLEDFLRDQQWKNIISNEFKKLYFIELKTILNNQVKKKKTIFPAKNDIFAALNYCPFDKVKVVILGQDPYQTPNFAHGLSFSVPPGITVPKSLINIYQELCNDIPGFKAPKHGTLIKWAEQGVLLLNTVLTVESGISNSHKGKGWENFTDEVIRACNKKNNIVFILWGRHAQDKSNMIDGKRHFILKSAHPSPLSASKGFFGCKHFSKCNAYLKKNGIAEIDWKSL